MNTKRKSQKPFAILTAAASAKSNIEVNTMSTANFNGARPVIDVNDTAMIDHQSGLFQTVGDMPMPELRARAAALAKMASLPGSR
jgi:hypothetical protein